MTHTSGTAIAEQQLRLIVRQNVTPDLDARNILAALRRNARAKANGPKISTSLLSYTYIILDFFLRELYSYAHEICQECGVRTLRTNFPKDPSTLRDASMERIR